MDVEALRDHAASMLDAMALDLEQPQTDVEQARKGKGDASAPSGSPRSAAEEHGLGRAQRGFTMEETFAEYRALRASVMRFYVAERDQPDATDVQDVIRFNEAIDQALAESVTEYARTVNRYRDMFLAVLGHDLRSPLGAVLNAATVLAEHAGLTGRERGLATMISRSATTMSALVEDLLEYTAEELGQGISLRRHSTDLVAVVEDVAREAGVGNPGVDVRVRAEGPVVGEWDAPRIRQALSNLVTNAARHAPEGSPVTVTLSPIEATDEVAVAVHNDGAPIPEAERELIFQPFRGAAPGTGASGGGGRLGLGLYIARLMAEAHGGTVTVETSAQDGTTFTLRLPTRPTA